MSIAGLRDAAARRNVPLVVLDLDASAAQPPYGSLTRVCPDRHVAWRADEESAKPLDLIDLVHGAATILRRV